MGDSQALLLRGVSGLNADPLPVSDTSRNGVSDINGADATTDGAAENGGSENGADSTESDSTSNGHHDDVSTFVWFFFFGFGLILFLKSEAACCFPMICCLRKDPWFPMFHDV